LRNLAAYVFVFVAAMSMMMSKIWERMLGKQEMRIFMMGVDGAGLQAILWKLKSGDMTTISDDNFLVEWVGYKKIFMTVWGSQCRFEKEWRKHYIANTQGLIFVVDSSDRDGIEDAREELTKMLNEADTWDAADAVLLVFANRQDSPNAMTVPEVTEKLGLDNLCLRRWLIQPVSAANGDGLYAGLDRMSSTMSVTKKRLQSVSPLPC